MDERNRKPESDIKLAKLIFADVFRDGGSYQASFETHDGLTYNIWLQRSKMPDDEGRHYRWLFEYFGTQRPEGCLPIVTGSREEKILLGRLRDFLASCTPEVASLSICFNDASLVRLRELVHYIERREPCFPFDLAGRPVG
jgi:hypothetical protein